MISNTPKILEEKDENGTSGLLIIAYSGLQAPFTKAKEIKKSFTFHEAIVCGKINEVKQYLKNDKKYANLLSNDGFTPLSLAAFFNQTNMAKLLLKNQADPNLPANNPSQVNALHAAVAKENYALCKLMIELGADVNAKQMQNVTPLHSATHRGDFKIVKLLIQNGAEINCQMDNGDTPIAIAERGGYMKIKLYLEKYST